MGEREPRFLNRKMKRKLRMRDEFPEFGINLYDRFKEGQKAKAKEKKKKK